MDLCCGSPSSLDAILPEATISPRERALPPTDALNTIPLYADFFNTPEKYQRIHVQLIGVTHQALVKRRNKKFGFVRWFDAIPDPYVKVKTVGPDTGSTDYFSIGAHQFPVLKDTATPVWDAKCVLIAKKEGTDGIQFVMLDKNRGKDDILLEFTLPKEEWPATIVDESMENPGQWTEFVKKPEIKVNVDEEEEGTAELENRASFELVFRIKVTDGANAIVSPQDTTALLQETKEIAYSEQVLEPTTDEKQTGDEGLLQCWKQKAGCNKAVLWILGRNDCFMHPHVAQRLFWSDRKYDLYVLNYSMNGFCRAAGFVRDAHLNSHNRFGNFDVYNDQVQRAIDVICAGNYETIIGYAHSTGAPVLLNYLMERGDEEFDGFIFNSPFLDWGFVGGDLRELLLENTSLLQKLGAIQKDQKLGVKETPEEFKDTPIFYLGQEIVPSAWAAKLWSQYHCRWEGRPLYEVPMTGGFAMGVTAVHKKIQKWSEDHKPITTKPFLCITSRGDDTLKATETISRADWIGPSRWEIELNDNGHDIFLSADVSDTVMAIEMVASWMKCKRFH